MAGKFDRKQVVQDILANEKQMSLLAKHPNQESFVSVKRDLSGIDVYVGGKLGPLKLVEPSYHYDLKTLQQRQSPGGGVDFGIQIDPVHPDALSKKRAVPAYFERYRIEAGAKDAKRVLRLPPDKRRLTWLATRDFAIVLRGNRGFARGGAKLEIYKL